MELLHRVCCGLDIHKSVIVACLIIQLGTKKVREIRSFPTVTSGLKELRAWLQAKDCTCAAMEATGVYWMPAYQALEGTVGEVIVANALHIKHVPGRKTDVSDSEWICDLARHGLLRASFVPAMAFRRIRELTRFRHKLVQSGSTDRNRLLKVLEQAGIKLASFLSDVFGVSGRAMLSALIEGTQSAAEMAKLAKGTLKSKIPGIASALEAPLQETTRFLLKGLYQRILATERHIADLDAQIATLVTPYQRPLELLQTIVGIGSVAAAAIIGEAGVDLLKFRGQGAFAFWCGVCPGNNMSAGKRKRAPTNRGNVFVRSLLVECAWAAIKSEGYLSTKYYKLKARRGAKRAIVAIAHKLAIAIYQVLTKGEAYRDLGADHVDRRKRPALAKLARRLEAHGYKVIKPASPKPSATPSAARAEPTGHASEATKPRVRAYVLKSRTA